MLKKINKEYKTKWRAIKQLLEDAQVLIYESRKTELTDAEQNAMDSLEDEIGRICVQFWIVAHLACDDKMKEEITEIDDAADEDAAFILDPDSMGSA